MNKTISEIINLLEKYKDEYKKIEERNKACVEGIEEFQYAIEILKRDGNLTEQIKKNDEELKTLAVNQNLRSENSISIMSFYKTRKDLEKENESLKTINTVIGNMNLKEMFERIKKAEHELADTMKNDIEQQEKNIAMIDNIGKVCKEKIRELKENKEDMLNENELAESKARTLIENMKNLEAEIKKFEMFINEGILTHSQTAHINSVVNRQKDTTRLFAEIVLGKETEPEEIINSLNMNNYYKKFVSENANKVEALNTEAKTDLLRKIISGTNIIDGYIKPEIPEIKEEVIELKEEKVEENKPKFVVDDEYAKQFPYLFDGIEMDKKENKIPNQDDDYFKQFPYLFKGLEESEKSEKLKEDINTFINKPKKEEKVEEPKNVEEVKQEGIPEILTKGNEAAMEFIRKANEKKKEETPKVDESLSEFMERNSVKKDTPKDEIKAKIDDIKTEAEIPKVEAEVVSEDNFNIDGEQAPIVDVEPEELKSVEEIKNEQQSSLNNYDKNSFYSVFGNENIDTKNTKTSEENIKYQSFDANQTFDDSNLKEDPKEEKTEEQQSSLNNKKETDFDEVFKYIDPNPIFVGSSAEEENTVQNHESIYEETSRKEELIKDDEPRIEKAETVDMSSQFDTAINNNKKEQKPIEKVTTKDGKKEQSNEASTEADIIAEAIKKIMDRKNPSQVEVEQPKEVPLFSKISKKIKRKKQTSERYKDIMSSVEVLKQEVNQEELDNNNSHRR